MFKILENLPRGVEIAKFLLAKGQVNGHKINLLVQRADNTLVNNLAKPLVCR